jgi:putative ABC transport system substrate-binding protein
MQRTGRRRFLFGAVALAAAPIARAQAPGGKRTLGVLSPHPYSSPERDGRRKIYAKYFEQLGWRMGDNLMVERPEHPDGEVALAAMAEALVRKRPDAILAVGAEAAVAAARATKAIPIVFWGVPFPVEQGLIESYALPGGNVTGVAFFTGSELIAKLLQIFRELAPGVRRISAITTPSSVSTVQGGRFRESGASIQAAAQEFGFHYRMHVVATIGDFESVFREILDSRAQGLVTLGTTVTFRNRGRIIEFAQGARLLHGANQAEFAESGALFSYGPNTVETNLQSIAYVDKVLRGVNPAELPVERPAKYELALNLTTAGALGVAIPRSLLLRADRVIE